MTKFLRCHGSKIRSMVPNFSMRVRTMRCGTHKIQSMASNFLDAHHFFSLFHVTIFFYFNINILNIQKIKLPMTLRTMCEAIFFSSNLFYYYYYFKVFLLHSYIHIINSKFLSYLHTRAFLKKKYSFPCMHKNKYSF